MEAEEVTGGDEQVGGAVGVGGGREGLFCHFEDCWGVLCEDDVVLLLEWEVRRRKEREFFLIVFCYLFLYF